MAVFYWCLMEYITSEGDILDLVCHHYYAGKQGATEQVLQANPFLSELPAILPAGVKIELPAIEINKIINQISLWD